MMLVLLLSFPRWFPQVLGPCQPGTSAVRGLSAGATIPEQKNNVAHVCRSV